MTPDVDVVVVGAGPVGLLAAVELALGGAQVLVLERLDGPSLVSKALGIGLLGAEALQRRGMGVALDEAEAATFAATERAGGMTRARTSRFNGHFGGLFIPRDPQDTGARRMRMVNQQAVEAMLAARADALGIPVKRGCDVTGLAQDAAGVTLDWTGPDGAQRIRCAYLVGCDGGRSTIRKRAGFAFPGTPPSLTMFQAVVDLDHPERLGPVGWTRAAGGVFSFGALPRRLFMVDFSGPPQDRDAPVTLPEVEDALRRVSGADVRVTVLDGASRWTDNTRLVDTYRQGRVLLAGDAAHVHSPFGGQGLSLGLVDACNLGWKLAAVLRGDAPDGLLDSYTAERRPVAEAVLANTLAQVAIMRPDPQSGALRAMLAGLLDHPPVAHLLAAAMSGLAVRYDLGAGPDPVGRLLGDEALGQGDTEGSLYALLQDGCGLLLDASPGGAASRLVAAATDRVRCVPAAAGPSRLIRPDACLAWTGPEHDLGGLEEAVARWFAPRQPARSQLRMAG